MTGASRGIGAAIATRLAAEGADVAITARTRDPDDHQLPGSLSATAAVLTGFGRRAVMVVADLSKPDERARIVPEAEAGLDGPIDILVNNAAMAIYEPLLDYPLRRRHLTFEVNVHAPLDLAQAVAPGMVARGQGWILNVSSATARLTPGPPFPKAVLGATIGVYGASKAALNRMTNALAFELAGTGVRVNTVEPRAAVMSPGADQVVGGRLRPDQIESMEEMVEAATALCCCEPERTGHIHVSLDVIAELGLEVHELDGSARSHDQSAGAG